MRRLSTKSLEQSERIPLGTLKRLKRLKSLIAYVEIIRAPALAYTHASASKQAAQLSTRAPLTAKVHRTICLLFAMPALCLPDTLWLYTLVKNPGSCRQGVPFFAFFVAFLGTLTKKIPFLYQGV